MKASRGSREFRFIGAFIARRAGECIHCAGEIMRDTLALVVLDDNDLLWCSHIECDRRAAREAVRWQRGRAEGARS
jgi:hypothetical protein